MKLLFPTMQARPFYDRNAIYAGLAYNVTGLAPHAYTSRASYTVPANRRGLLTGIGLYWKRETAAGTPGMVRVWCVVNWGANYGAICNLASMLNAVNDKEVVNFPCQIWLETGMSFTLATEIGGVGGTNAFWLSATYVEFGS